MTNQPKPAPTAEEQLPEVSVKHDSGATMALCVKYGPEFTGWEVALAALRSNREKDAQLADRDNHIKYAYAALGEVNQSVYVFDHIHALKQRHEAQLAEKDAKIAELEGK